MTSKNSISETTNYSYRKLNGFDEYEECFKLQQEIFGLEEKDTFAPVQLNLLNRDFPKNGYAIGALKKTNEKEELIGFFLATASFEPKSLYGILMGIKPGFVNKGIGFQLFLKLRQLALLEKKETLYFIYEPLDSKLGNFYFNKLGVLGIKYEIDAFKLCNHNYPVDKLLVQWDFYPSDAKSNITGKTKKPPLNDIINKYPIADTKHFFNSEKVLLKIPDDLFALKKEDYLKALAWRETTRNLFDEYVNSQGYCVTGFYSQIQNNQRENYYLLEKKN